jgi:hypothetical protein
MNDAELNAIIEKLRTHTGWWNGDQVAKRILNDLFVGYETQIAGLKKALEDSERDSSDFSH